MFLSFELERREIKRFELFESVGGTKPIYLRGFINLIRAIPYPELDRCANRPGVIVQAIRGG